jgi:hypothetical protein
MEMVILKGESEFEVSIREVDGEWEGQIIEYNIGRLTPTLHLRHSWTSAETAIAGIRRRWQRLFPDGACPDFREAITASFPLREHC